MVSTSWKAMEQARSAREAQQQNTGGYAWAWGRVNTKGFGEFAHPTEVNFALAYIAMPVVSYSCSTDDELIETRFPRCHGGVYRWVQDHNGHYRGAYVYTTVDTEALGLTVTAPEPNYSITHHFMFLGIAYKALPDRIGADFPS